MTRCALCGWEFDRAEMAPSCSACPIARGCRLIRCPRCGYEWPEESRWLTWLREHWSPHESGKSR